MLVSPTSVTSIGRTITVACGPAFYSACITANIVDGGNGGGGAGYFGALTKAGTGRLELSGTNTYTGVTHRYGGILNIQSNGLVPSPATPRRGA